VIETAKKFVMVKIDAEKDSVTPTKYNVEAVPTLVVLNASGKQISRTVGFIPASQMLQEMNKVKPTGKSARRR